MLKQIDNLTHVEQELDNLYGQIQTYLSALESLAATQAQFETLAITHQKFESAIADTREALENLNQFQASFDIRFNQLEAGLEDKAETFQGSIQGFQQENLTRLGAIQQAQEITQNHLSELEAKIRFKVEELSGEISNLQNRLGAFDQTQVEGLSREIARLQNGLGTADKARLEGLYEELTKVQHRLNMTSQAQFNELSEEMGNMRRQVEQRLSVISEEWERQQESMQTLVDEFEERLKSELNSTLNRANQGGLNSLHVDKLEHLDVRVRGIRTSLKNLDRDFRMTRNWLSTVVVIVGLSLVFVIWMLL